ncbi:MAG: hypothetical protein AAGK21_05835 [Bacteroidota bacterium]
MFAPTRSFRSSLTTHGSTLYGMRRVRAPRRPFSGWDVARSTSAPTRQPQSRTGR